MDNFNLHLFNLAINFTPNEILFTINQNRINWIEKLVKKFGEVIVASEWDSKGTSLLLLSEKVITIDFSSEEWVATIKSAFPIKAVACLPIEDIFGERWTDDFDYADVTIGSKVKSNSGNSFFVIKKENGKIIAFSENQEEGEYAFLVSQISELRLS